MDRTPAVAGTFYPGTREELEDAVASLMGEAEKSPALGVVSPHAGYVYSGSVAGAVFSKTVVPDVCVILAPNHTGTGDAAFAVWADGKWLMPMGDVFVEEGFARKLLQACSAAAADESAHVREHSAEVQVPFLQAANPSVRIVPVVISSHNLAALQEFGKSLAGVIQDTAGDVLVVASSDMTHYEDQETARTKDQLAIDTILALDEKELLRVVVENRISMCGVAPTVAMLTCCRALGAREATLITYQTSGDVTGDVAQVVGYAGLVVR
ncbi:AmmeMemoRadiSam system protein B [Planctomycetota bacterium]